MVVAGVVGVGGGVVVVVVDELEVVGLESVVDVVDGAVVVVVDGAVVVVSSTVNSAPLRIP